MQTVMFSETIFGPIHSRRLGTSLGVNLSPRDGKVCSFDCLYCEAGFNAQGHGTSGLPSRAEVADLLQQRLEAMSRDNQQLDVITFSGNGEPTLNPEFPGIIHDTLALRDKYFPQVKVSVLSNSTMLGHPEIVAALQLVDNCILKLDSAINSTMLTLDRPTSPSYTAQRAIDLLAGFGPKAIIQTMLTRGSYNATSFDNTTPAEIDALIEAYRRIAPREIMLYSLDRPTPATDLEKIPADQLRLIANRIARATQIPIQLTV